MIKKILHKNFFVYFLTFVLIGNTAGVYAEGLPDDLSEKGSSQEMEETVITKSSFETAKNDESGKSDEVDNGAVLNDARGKKGATYKLLLGDRLNVRVYPEDQYIKGGAMQVSSEGTITLPLIGRVDVAGKTLAEAEKDIAKIIDANYLVNPEVVIELSESTAEKALGKKRKVIALGQIRKPGSYDWPEDKEKMTLLELISLAGGFTEIANVRKIKIIRRSANGQKETQSVNGEKIMTGSDPDVDLRDGDIVNVSESVF